MQVAVRRLGLLLSALLVLSTGCSTFDKHKDPLGDYAESSDEEVSTLDRFKEKFKELTGQGPDPVLARQLFDEAQPVYAGAVQLREQDVAQSQKQFLAVAEKFSEAAERWPDSALEEEALFLLGECYFFADHYPQAEEAFAKLVKRYPRTRYLDNAQARRFAIAQYWLQLWEQEQTPWYTVNILDKSRPTRDYFGHAMRVFDRIRLDDPTGKLADDATLAMANAHFGYGKFMKADEYYTDLRKTFPSSEHQFRAHFLGLKAKLESYQGVEYGGTALEEAGKLVTQIRKQFPVEAEVEREYLARSAAEIRYRQGEREWHRARRHDRRSEYGAARMYYASLAQQFQDTPFGEQATQRLAEIGGEPDVPPQRMSWLVSLFPERETVKPMIATSPATTTRR